MSEEITALCKEIRQICRVILFMATIWLIVVIICIFRCIHIVKGLLD